MWYDNVQLDWFAKAVTAVTAGIVALMATWKAGRRAWKRMVQFAQLEQQYVNVAAQLANMTTLIDEVHKQITPNGGGSMSDVLHRVECAQHWQQERVKALLSEVSYGVWESDREGECYWANDVLIQWAGGRLTDLNGSNWQNIVDPRDRDLVVKEWRSTIEQERDFRQGCRLLNHRTGEVREVVAKATLLRDKSGNAIGWIGTITPVGNTCPWSHEEYPCADH